MGLRDDIVARILEERARQFNLPGSEWDATNLPNDWVAIVTHYVAEEVRRGTILPNKTDFEDNLIKAAAVIIAALEHLDTMDNKGAFRAD